MSVSLLTWLTSSVSLFVSVGFFVDKLSIRLSVTDRVRMSVFLLTAADSQTDSLRADFWQLLTGLLVSRGSDAVFYVFRQQPLAE